MALGEESGRSQDSFATYHKGPVWLFAFATIIVVLIEGSIVLTMGRGPVLFVLPWVEIVAESFSVLVALSITYFCIGRYHAVDEPGTLWVGLAFLAYSIFSIFYLLVFPDVIDSASALAIHPNAFGWPFHLKWTSLVILFITAALARWPTSYDRKNRIDLLLLAVASLTSLSIAVLIFVLGQYIPPLVVDGRFTLLNLQWTTVLVLLFVLGTILALRKSIQGKQVIVGYTATVQAVLAIRLASDIFGGQLFDVIWYLNRVLLVGGFSVMLFALLSEHVGLLRSQTQLYSIADRRAAQLQGILDSMADAVFVLDARGNIVDANARAQQLLGFTGKEEALPPLGGHRQFLEASHLDGQPLKPEEYSGARALKGETVRGFLERARTPDGRELTLEVSASPIRDVNQRIVGAVVVARDMTELEWTRTRATVARVATAVAQSLTIDDLVRAVLDEAGAALKADLLIFYSIDEANRRLVMLGQRNLPQEMLERLQTISFDTPTLSARAVTTGSIQVLDDLHKAPPDLAIPRELGDRFGFGGLIAVPLKARGRVIGSMTFASRQPRKFSTLELEAIRTIADIIAVGLENARLYDTAEEERRRLSAIIENSPEGILLFSAPDGRILLANKAAEKMIGRPIRRETPMELHPQEYGVCRPDGTPYPSEELPSSKALRGEVVLGVEAAFCRRNGRSTPILVNAAPIRDTEGKITGAITIFQDISAIKELERQREEFVSVVAHDLRGALTPVRGFADLLMRPETKESLPKKVQQSLEAIANGTRRMERMIADLLDVSRIEARRLTLIKKPIDLPSLISEIVQRSAGLLKGHPTKIEVRGEIPKIEADPDRIEQIMENLLSNAAKYSYPETLITVQIERRDGEVMVSVTNLGQGIEAEDREQLFTRFYRTKIAQREEIPGLGLGLYITRGLVEAHGGRIWVESEPGRETTFRFVLPVA